MRVGGCVNSGRRLPRLDQLCCRLGPTSSRSVQSRSTAGRRSVYAAVQRRAIQRLQLEVEMALELTTDGPQSPCQKTAG